MHQSLLCVIVIFNRRFTLFLTLHRFLGVRLMSGPSLDGHCPLNVFKWMFNHMYHSLPLSTGRMQADHGPSEVQFAVGLSRWWSVSSSSKPGGEGQAPERWGQCWSLHRGGRRQLRQKGSKISQLNLHYFQAHCFGYVSVFSLVLDQIQDCVFTYSHIFVSLYLTQIGTFDFSQCGISEYSIGNNTFGCGFYLIRWKC